MLKKSHYYLKYGLALTLITFIISGCGGTTEQPASPTTETSSANNFRVALVLTGPIDDGAWNGSGYEGLQLIKQELDAEVDYIENVAIDDAEDVFRQYAQENYDFIIGHGGRLEASIKVVAAEFPRIKFVVSTVYAGNNRNLGAVSFRDGEVGYLTGVVAGLKTETNKVAYVGGAAIPALVEQATLFERGAKSVNPDVQVHVEWLEDWNDQAKAKAVAETLLADQVDVFTVDANIAGLAVHEVAQQAGVYSIGWSKDQHEIAPETILTSAVQHPALLLLKAAKLVKLGRWEGKLYKFGLHDGVQELAPFYGLLTPEEEEQVNQVKADIMTGKIHATP